MKMVTIFLVALCSVSVKANQLDKQCDVKKDIEVAPKETTLLQCEPEDPSKNKTWVYNGAVLPDGRMSRIKGAIVEVVNGGDSLLVLRLEDGQHFSVSCLNGNSHTTCFNTFTTKHYILSKIYFGAMILIILAYLVGLYYLCCSPCLQPRHAVVLGPFTRRS